MQTITIEIDDAKKLLLSKKAAKLGFNIEEYLKITIDDILLSDENDFNQLIDYIFTKNDELYHRLAK